jgi:hypothetical protein
MAIARYQSELGSFGRGSERFDRRMRSEISSFLNIQHVHGY